MLREELGELGPVICKSHLTFLFKMQDIPTSPSPHPHHCLPSLGKHSGFSVRKRLMTGLKTERFLPSLPFPLIFPPPNPQPHCFGSRPPSHSHNQTPSLAFLLHSHGGGGVVWEAQVGSCLGRDCSLELESTGLAVLVPGNLQPWLWDFMSSSPSESHRALEGQDWRVSWESVPLRPIPCDPSWGSILCSGFTSQVGTGGHSGPPPAEVELLSHIRPLVL